MLYNMNARSVIAIELCAQKIFFCAKCVSLVKNSRLISLNRQNRTFCKFKVVLSRSDAELKNGCFLYFAISRLNAKCHIGTSLYSTELYSDYTYCKISVSRPNDLTNHSVAYHELWKPEIAEGQSQLGLSHTREQQRQHKYKHLEHP